MFLVDYCIQQDSVSYDLLDVVPVRIHSLCDPLYC